MVFKQQIYAKEIAILLDSPFEPDIASSVNVQACWESKWVNYLWLCVQDKFQAVGFNVFFLNNSTKKSDFIAIAKKSTYILDARENSFEQVYFWSKQDLEYTKKLILLIWEPHITCPAVWQPSFHKKCHKILTWNDQLVDNQKYFLFKYPVYTNFQINSELLLDFENRQLQCLILANKLPAPGYAPKYLGQNLYQERLNYINFCEQNKLQFDLYGRGWRKSHASYKGAIGPNDKSKILSQYKFAIAYENSRETGYVTEKIFDCFRAGCVPVYFGAYNIEEFIPKNCFVDRRDFANNQALYNYLINMNKETYMTYMQNIQVYLNNDAWRFSVNSFADSVVQAI